MVSSDTFPAQVHFYGKEQSPTNGNRIDCQGHFLFMFVRSGILRMVIDGNKVACTSGELLITLCRNYYQVIKYNKKSLCYLVRVEWQFLTDIKMSGRFIELIFSKHMLKLFPDVIDSKILLRIMKLLHYYYECRQDIMRFPMRSFTAALSLLIFQAAWQQDSSLGTHTKIYSRKELLTMQFLRLLIQHYKKEHHVAYYATALCVTEGYLSKIVREITGKTLLKCIAELLVSEAKYLLLNSENTIEDISEQLHFTSSGSFSRFFKKETALRPTSYRKAQIEHTFSGNNG